MAFNKFIKKVLYTFTNSMKSINGNFSHTKISSYFILVSIILSTCVFLIIEIGNARLEWHKGRIYEIPVNHIGLFAMVLSHHLILLGLKNSNDKIIADSIQLNDGNSKKEKEDN